MLTGEIKSLRQARDIAKACTHAQKKKVLNDACDLFDYAVENLHSYFTAEHLQTAVAMWALIERVASLIPDVTPTAPLSGETEAARLAA